MSIVSRACGKVNLALAVGPPLPASHPHAGMHPIASWMHAIDLADELTVERAPQGAGVEIDLQWASDAARPTPLDWPHEHDLCVRAAHALAQAASRPVDVRIRLSKRIPVGAGLGGGSSDAAATLLAINDLFDLELSVQSLRTISAQLGSDIAFFIDEADPPRPAIVSGLGDRIERVDPTRGELVLCIPSFSCRTGAVYRAFDAFHPSPLDEDTVRALAAEPIPDSHRLFNDLARAAEQTAPDLRGLRDAIADTLGAPVHITGSGSAMFALADPDAASKLCATHPDVFFIESRLI